MTELERHETELPTAVASAIHHPVRGGGLRWTVPGARPEDGPTVDVFEREVVLGERVVVERDHFTSFVRIAREALKGGEALAQADLDTPITMRSSKRPLTLGMPTLSECVNAGGNVCGRVVAAGRRSLILTSDGVGMLLSWPPTRVPGTLRETIGLDRGTPYWRGVARAAVYAGAFDPRVSDTDEDECPSDASPGVRALGDLARWPREENVALWVTTRRLTVSGTAVFIEFLLGCGWSATEDSHVVTLHKEEADFERIWTASRDILFNAASRRFNGYNYPQLLEDLA